VTARVWECVYNLCPNLASQVSVHQPTQISIVRSCVFCHLVEMILLNAFAVNGAAVIGDVFRPARLLSWWLG
jgi:hypothetical protein